MAPEREISSMKTGALQLVNTPRFRSHLTVETIGKDTVLFSSEGRFISLKRKGLVQVAAQIDGQKHTEEIVDQLKGVLAPNAVYLNIFILQLRGFIVESQEKNHHRPSAAPDLFESNPMTSHQRLSGFQVSVVALAEVPSGKLLKSLRSLGIKLKNQKQGMADDRDRMSPGKNFLKAERDSGRNGVVSPQQIDVVMVDDYLNGGLEKFHREAARSGRFWMLVKPSGKSVWWGPLFIPGKTACWDCLALRLKENRWTKTLSSRSGASLLQTGDPSLHMSTILETGLNLAALSLLHWILDPDFKDLENRVYSLDVISMQLDHHHLFRLQHCPFCGQRRLDLFQKPLERPLDQGLLGREDHRDHQNDFNVKRPHGEMLLQKESFEVEAKPGAISHLPGRLERHISPITGIVCSINPTFEAEEIPIFVYQTAKAFGEKGKPEWFPQSIPIFWCSGTGKSRTEAGDSALCEAIERYSGVFRGDESRRISSFRELGAAAVYPNSIMNFSEKQLSRRESSESYSDYWIPAALDKGCKIEWTPVWSLTRKKIKYLPTALCYYGFEGAGTRFCKADSNGCAAGENLQEAIVNGFFELVERDAVALWWYNRIRRAGIELESLDLPWIQRVIDYHLALDREISVLEITSDLEIPTFAAISRSHSGNLDNLILGFGTHFQPIDAITRAILEMHQMLPGVVAGESTTSSTGLTNEMRSIDSWLRASSLQPVSAISGDESSDKSHKHELERCLELTEKHKLEILVLDQTRHETGLPVVKVFVPTLRPWWARFGQGRLYNIPVNMRWLEKPLTEGELNSANLIL
jgi:ribosomal protein S12 methylthiotransferase accessory factor